MKTCFNHLMVLASLGSLTSHAETINSTANWGDSIKWSPATVPDAIDAAATVGNAAGGVTITLATSGGLNASYTIGSLTFSQINQTRTIQNVSGGSGVLIFDKTTGPATISSSVSSNARNINVGLQLNDDLTITSVGSSLMTFSKPIASGTGLTTGVTIKGGSGSTQTIAFGAANSYTGATLIEGSATSGRQGKLRTTVDAALPSTTSLTINNVASGGGGRLDLYGTTQTVAQLSSSGTSGVAGVITNAGGVSTTAAATFKVSSTTLNSSFSGVIENGTGITHVEKDGAGTSLTLSNTNTYTGTTKVNGGKLIINGSISTSITTVNNGGALGGTGTVGAITIKSGGTLEPGNSTAILDAGNTSLEAGSTFGIEINSATIDTGYDQLNTTGTVSLAGLLSITMGYTPAGGDLFFILANDDTDAISGVFSNASVDGGTYNLGGQQFEISYFGNQTAPGVGTFTGGNDVVLRAVPEPNVAALFGGLGTLLLLRRKRVGGTT